jgi:uncharacterized lipoprotein YddW (UPF0748 family)
MILKRKLLLLLLSIPMLLIGCGGSGSSSDDNGGNTGGNTGGGTTTSSYFSGTWVTNVASTALNSKANIQTCVANCKKYGINNIFMVVWNKARTMYPSKVMEDTFGTEYKQDANFSGRDPLAEMITEAHNNNIKVYAWFEYGFAASYSSDGGDIIKLKPGWAGKDASGNLLMKNGFSWMNSFLPEVQNFMISLFKEVITNYNVDGVMGDDRLPACPVEGGYDDYTLKLYQQEKNITTTPASNDATWIDWRTNKLTEFMSTLYKACKAVKSSVEVVSAPSPYPWGKTNYLQDWPTWLTKGYIDRVIPQVYRSDISTYKTTLAQQLTYVSAANKSKFSPGILIQNGNVNPSEDLLKQMIAADRGSSLTGECFWFYEGLSHFDSYFSTYKK